MKLDASDVEAIRPLIIEAVREALSIAQPTSGANSSSGSPSAPASKLLWSEQDAAAALSISPLTLKKWRERGYVRSHTTTRPILYTWPQIEAIAAWLPGRSSDS